MEHDVKETGQMAAQLWGNSARSVMTPQLFRLLTADSTDCRSKLLTGKKKTIQAVSSKWQFVNNYPIESKVEQVILRNLLWHI